MTTEDKAARFILSLLNVEINESNTSAVKEGLEYYNLIWQQAAEAEADDTEYEQEAEDDEPDQIDDIVDQVIEDAETADGHDPDDEQFSVQDCVDYLWDEHQIHRSYPAVQLWTRQGLGGDILPATTIGRQSKNKKRIIMKSDFVAFIERNWNAIAGRKSHTSY